MSELEGEQKMTANFTESAYTTDFKFHTNLIMLGSTRLVNKKLKLLQ